MPVERPSPPSRPLPPVRRRTVLVGSAAAIGSAALADAKPVRLRFSHVVAPDTPKGQMAQRLQALVHQRAGGRIRVELFPDSSLWGDDDEMEALRLGAVEMLAPSLSKFGMAGVPEFEVFDLPYLFADLVQVRRVTQGDVGRGLLERLARQQMHGLGFLDNGFKQMSARRALRTPADYRGLRVRVQASRVLGEQVRALGAQPVVLPFGETQRALASGVVDAAENPLSNFRTQGLAALQPHLTLTQHGYLGYAVVTHPRFWASLSRADRALVDEALADALAHGNRLAEALDHQALASLRQTAGLRVHALEPAEREALRRHLRPVVDGFGRSVGAGLLRDIQKAVDGGT